ncbi:hypothetical protein [Domibacillus aminovorans]|nr:hypothetical protein [Domibacillus aminovorans]
MDQPPEMEPTSPPALSTTNNFHAPFGAKPLKLLNATIGLGAGAGGGKASENPGQLVGL